MNSALSASTLASFEAYLHAQDFEQAYLLLPPEEIALRLHLRQALASPHTPLYRRLTLECAQALQDQDPYQAFDLAYELDSELATLPESEVEAGRLATLSVMAHCLVALGANASARDVSQALGQEALRHQQWALASWAFHQKSQVELSLGATFQALQDVRTATGLSLRANESELVAANAELRATLSFHLGLLTEAIEQAELALKHHHQASSALPLQELLAQARLHTGQDLKRQLKQLPALQAQLETTSAQALADLALPWQQGHLPDYQPHLLLTPEQHHLWQSAQTHYREGALGLALEAFDALLIELGVTLDGRLSQAFAHLGRAHMLALLGDAEGAVADTQHAIKLGLALENMALYGKASLFLGKLYLDLGHPHQSLEHLQHAHHICLRFGAEGYARALALDSAQALKALASPVALDTELQHTLESTSLDLDLPPFLRFQVLLALVQLYCHLGELSQAQHHLFLAQTVLLSLPTEATADASARLQEVASVLKSAEDVEA